MYYRFSVDDNIWFLRDLTCGEYSSLFDHPYLKLYYDLHKKYDAKFQLNIYLFISEFQCWKLFCNYCTYCNAY